MWSHIPFSSFFEWATILLIAVLQTLFAPQLPPYEAETDGKHSHSLERPGSGWKRKGRGSGKKRRIPPSQRLWIGSAWLTVVCDTLLLYPIYDAASAHRAEGIYALGVALFAGVQALRMVALAPRAAWRIVPLAALVSGVAIAIGGVSQTNWAPGYAILLLTNVFLSGKSHNKLRTLGFLLFLFCDVSVALYQLPLSPGISFVMGRAIWVFYLPSQILLAIAPPHRGL